LSSKRGGREAGEYSSKLSSSTIGAAICGTPQHPSSAMQMQVFYWNTLEGTLLPKAAGYTPALTMSCGLQQMPRREEVA
jgi:hypothetical protein